MATHGHSPFVTRPYIQRLSTDRHDTLDALVWTTQRPGREPVSQTVRPNEVPKLLEVVFGIRIDSDEAGLLVTRLTELDSGRQAATAKNPR